MEKEMTDAQLARLDKVHKEIFGLVLKLIPNRQRYLKGREVLEWDMEYIGAISDGIEAYLVKNGICTEMEFAPYLEEK